ncbi:MAG: hypothetical protein ACO20I_10145 [bacterium]
MGRRLRQCGLFLAGERYLPRRNQQSYLARSAASFKQPEFKAFGRNVGDRMTAVAQRDTMVALHHSRRD